MSDDEKTEGQEPENTTETAEGSPTGAAKVDEPAAVTEQQLVHVGSIVHYLDGARPVAAIVTWVHNQDCVNLKAFTDNPEGTRHITSVPIGSDAGCFYPIYP